MFATTSRGLSSIARIGMGVTLAVCVAAASAQAADCTASDLARAVDQSGAELRSFNGAVQPKLQERMRRLADLKKMPQENYEELALDAVQDETLAGLDAKTSELLLKIDTLGRAGDETVVPCTRVEDIKTSSTALLGLMREKADYMSASLDKKISEAAGPDKQAAVTPEAVAPEAVSPENAKNSESITPTAKPAAPPPAKPAAKPKDTQTAVQALPEIPVKPNDAYVPPPVAAAEPQQAVLQVGETASDGYSIDEIQDATRGFFGTVSTGLASVIEHAFQTSGRPTAYVLGTEGGGAFLAGLRYGRGKLYFRHSAETQNVFWHGPSLGTDVGASGSRTMFLIYSLKDREDLFRIFTGIDGSAYFVGGVGLTLLKGGDVFMAPIRSGLGFRVGANIGYVRFTGRATWNPF